MLSYSWITWVIENKSPSLFFLKQNFSQKIKHNKEKAFEIKGKTAFFYFLFTPNRDFLYKKAIILNQPFIDDLKGDLV